MTNRPPLSNIQAMLMAFMGFTLWNGSDAIIRYLNDYNAVSVAFLAGTSCSILALVFSPLLGGLRTTFTQPQLKLRIARGFVIAVSSFFSFVAFANLELATAYAIIFVTPLLAKVLSALLTKEAISWRSWLISLLGFSGVLVVVRPGFIPIDIGSMAALAGAITFASGFVLGRKIGKDDQTLLSMIIFQYLFLMLGCLLWGPNDLIHMPWPHILIGLSIGIFSFSATLLVSNAYASAPTQYVAPVHYVQILWGALLGAVLFNEYPDIYTIIGGTTIVGAGLLLIKYSR